MMMMKRERDPSQHIYVGKLVLTFCRLLFIYKSQNEVVNDEEIFIFTGGGSFIHSFDHDVNAVDLVLNTKKKSFNLFEKRRRINGTTDDGSMIIVCSSSTIIYYYVNCMIINAVKQVLTKGMQVASEYEGIRN